MQTAHALFTLLHSTPIISPCQKETEITGIGYAEEEEACVLCVGVMIVYG